jgi:hypothetical protein
MPARVQQHVHKRMAHLARRAQDAHVVAVREHGPRALEDPVHGSREPRTDCLHAAPERISARGLDDQMRVVALERVVRKPELAAFAARSERVLELAHEAHRA